MTPGPASELAAVVGEEAALALIEAFPGSRIHIPRSARPDYRLASVVGMDTLAKLVAWRGGEDIKVPLERRWRVCLYRSRGMSWSAIALKLGISDGSVGKYLKEAGMTKPPYGDRRNP